MGYKFYQKLLNKVNSERQNYLRTNLIFSRNRRLPNRGEHWGVRRYTLNDRNHTGYSEPSQDLKKGTSNGKCSLEECAVSSLLKLNIDQCIAGLYTTNVFLSYSGRSRTIFRRNHDNDLFVVRSEARAKMSRGN